MTSRWESRERQKYCYRFRVTRIFPEFLLLPTVLFTKDRSLCVKKLLSGTIRVFSVKEKGRHPELREALKPMLKQFHFIEAKSVTWTLINSFQTESLGARQSESHP